ncbi:hypothetical protein M758_UG290400 [Ceratodon purpureus]|nr:hypothetical protein M758_UG290400 [Ceratodon purpureus]
MFWILGQSCELLKVGASGHTMSDTDDRALEAWFGSSLPFTGWDGHLRRYEVLAWLEGAKEGAANDLHNFHSDFLDLTEVLSMIDRVLLADVRPGSVRMTCPETMPMPAHDGGLDRNSIVDSLQVLTSEYSDDEWLDHLFHELTVQPRVNLNAQEIRGWLLQSKHTILKFKAHCIYPIVLRPASSVEQLGTVEQSSHLCVVCHLQNPKKDAVMGPCNCLYHQSCIDVMGPVDHPCARSVKSGDMLLIRLGFVNIIDPSSILFSLGEPEDRTPLAGDQCLMEDVATLGAEA